MLHRSSVISVWSVWFVILSLLGTLPGVWSQSQCTVQSCLFQPDSVTGLVSIPATTTSISACAFYQCSALKSVIIPAEVKQIAWYAFTDNLNLVSVSILCGSTLSIDYAAFSGSTIRSACTITASLSVFIPGYTFASVVRSQCCPITPQGGIVTIPNGVTAIPPGSFASCLSFTEVDVGPSVLSIGEGAFNGCGLTTISFTKPSGLLSIGKNAFVHSGLSAIEIPRSVVNISSGAFFQTFSLKSLTFQAGSQLTAIKDGAFQGSALTSVVIPPSVQIIGESSFSQASDLQSLSFDPSSISNLTLISRFAFSQAPLTSIDLPVSANVIRIESKAFSTAESVTALQLNVPCGCAATVDSSAFQNAQVTANAPASFRVNANGNQDSNPLITVVPRQCCLFTPNAQGVVVIPSDTLHIPNGAFASCFALRTVQLHPKVLTIGFGAFAGTSLTSLVLGPNVKEIGDYAFSNVNGLQSVTIFPNTAVGEFAFANITTLKSVIFNCDETVGFGGNVAHTAFYGSINALVQAIGGRDISPPAPSNYAAANPVNYPHFTYSCCGGGTLMPSLPYGPYCYCPGCGGGGGGGGGGGQSSSSNGGTSSGSATVPVVVSVVVIALAAGGAYWYYTQKNAAAMSAAAAASGEGMSGSKTSANLEIGSIYASSPGTVNPMQPGNAPVSAPRAPPAPPAGMQVQKGPPGRPAPPAPPVPPRM